MLCNYRKNLYNDSMHVQNRSHNRDSFTLIELIIVMVIIALLSALISGNFINSLQKGRDARRKDDLAQVQRALEIYYEDSKTYPTGLPTPGTKFCKGTCVSGSKIYMVNMPGDPNTSYAYAFQVDATNQKYYLFSCIENYRNDKGVNVSNNGYCDIANNCSAPPQCGDCGNCKYYLGSPNAEPLTPEPTLP